MNNLAIVITIILGIITLTSGLMGATWKLANRIAEVEKELASQLSAYREILLATNRRIERIENKIL